MVFGKLIKVYSICTITCSMSLNQANSRRIVCFSHLFSDLIDQSTVSHSFVNVCANYETYIFIVIEHYLDAMIKFFFAVSGELGSCCEVHSRGIQ